jgi:alpha-beta hydrolase superfamily lysophospholipase
MGEHSGCYEELAETLASTPGLVDVLRFDYRGHGLSPGGRGVVRSYDEFVSDLRAALDRAAEERPGVPRYVLGHSNGGLVALRAAIDDPEHRIAGLILSNPSLRIAARVPKHKYYAGLLLRRFAPSVTLLSTVLDEHLTRDPAHLALRKSDTLRHSRISAPTFFGMVEGGARVESRAEEIHVPVLMLIGGSDPVVQPRPTMEFFDRLGSADKTLKVYPEMLHEPLNEVGREDVVKEITTWLKARLGGNEGRI